MVKWHAFDVFLSHSSMDKDVVRSLAERLRGDGLRVWFDDWEMHPGDSIPASIEHGLENSRVLVLCMSANAFRSDWATLEHQTFRFRDPLNRERRFVPLRLDTAKLPDSLAQFVWVDWQHPNREQEYAKLVAACRRTRAVDAQGAIDEQGDGELLSLGHSSAVNCVAWGANGSQALSGSGDKTLRLWSIPSGECLRVFEGHLGGVRSLAWCPEGRRALSGADDNTLRVWDLKDGRCLGSLDGHSGSVWSVAWNADGHRALSGSDDGTLRVWDVQSGDCVGIFRGHSNGVMSVAWSVDGRRALSGSSDSTLRLWDIDKGQTLHVFEEHSGRVVSVAWTASGHYALSGSSDRTLRLWDVQSGRCVRVFEEHAGTVWSVTWSLDGRRALSGSDDGTLRVWNVETGRCMRVMEGHSKSVRSVAWSKSGRQSLSGSVDATIRLWDLHSGQCSRVFSGHSGHVGSVTWSADRRRLLSGSSDKTLRLADTDNSHCLRVFHGHSDNVYSVAWSPDEKQVLSGSFDRTLRLWNPETGDCLRVLHGHSDKVCSVVWSPDGKQALSGSSDRTLRLWDLETGRCLRVFEAQMEGVWSLAWHREGVQQALSGHSDGKLRLWDIGTGQCLQVFEGHSESVVSLAWSLDGKQVLSGSSDKTLRLWDAQTGRCVRVFEGHSGGVTTVAPASDGRLVVSGSTDKILRFWDVKTGLCLHAFKGHSGSIVGAAWSTDAAQIYSAAANGVVRTWNTAELISGPFPERTSETSPDYAVRGVEAQVQYTNAKVLLVGESGAGKTGLSLRLAFDHWEPSPSSTVGAWATQWRLPLEPGQGVEREIWLWDFGGQADQLLIHQLYMAETTLAVLVFDGQRSDLFESLGQWDRALVHASPTPCTKILAAGRIDAGGLRVGRDQIDEFAMQRGYSGFFETSALAGTGCRELRDGIIASIDWETLPWRSSPLVFKQLKEAIVALKDEGFVLMRFNELRDALRLRLATARVMFSDDELSAVVGLLAGPGVVWELSFGSWVLLQPERLNACAQAVIQTLRSDDLERGCLPEERVLRGDLAYHPSLDRLRPEEERIMLLAMHQTLVERSLCMRQHTEEGALLIFPSYFRRERPDLVGDPPVFVTYRFNGFLEDVYATLVVRLHHTLSFKEGRLWRYAADFKTRSGKTLGVKLSRLAEGSGEIDVYFDPEIREEEDKITFARYVHEHLLQNARDVQRFRRYTCSHCKTPVGNPEIAMRRLELWRSSITQAGTTEGTHGSTIAAGNLSTVICALCEQRVPLWDRFEEGFASHETRVRINKLQEQASLVLSYESGERALVGDIISTIALAGQSSREFQTTNHGPYIEIEFKDDAGVATGRKMHIVFWLRNASFRNRDPGRSEIFVIENAEMARHWADQTCPVLLACRDADGVVRWMEIRDWLRREIQESGDVPREKAFYGERLDVMSVRRWREKALGEAR